MKHLLLKAIAAAFLVEFASFREAWNEPTGNEYGSKGFRWAAPDGDWDGGRREERD